MAHSALLVGGVLYSPIPESTIDYQKIRCRGGWYKYAEACWGMNGENVPKQILSIASVQ